MGLLTMTEMLEQSRRIVSAVDVPGITDIDTGYGNAVNLHRTVREFQRAGVAFVQIEDQVIPKKCGHFTGKQVIPFDEAVLKIKAAVEAFGDSGLMIIADRCDRRRRLRPGNAARAGLLKQARKPCSSRRREAASRWWRSAAIFPASRSPIWFEGGYTPIVPAKELQAMGFQMAIYANMVLRSSVKAIQKSLIHLREAGDSVGILDEMITMDERARVTQKDRLDALEKRYVNAV